MPTSTAVLFSDMLLNSLVPMMGGGDGGFVISSGWGGVGWGAISANLLLWLRFGPTSAASLCSESVFRGKEGGLKRAAPTRSERSLRPSTQDTAARPPRPRCFGSARAQAAANERQLSSIKWDEHGTGSCWGSRGRSRHGGDPRPRALQRSGRDPSARFASLEPRIEPLARRSQHGVQPGTVSLKWWLWGEAGGKLFLALRVCGGRFQFELQAPAPRLVRLGGGPGWSLSSRTTDHPRSK